MTALLAIAKRELFSLWVTPLAWILLGLFTLLNGATFVTIVTTLTETTENVIDLGPIQAFYGQSVFIPLGYLVFCPVLTMRSLAEERRSGTAETLLCTRASATAIVLGKYLALVLTYVALWTPTLLYPFILRETGQVEWPVVASSYLGVLGLGLGFLSIGLFTSALSTNQLIAAALSSAIVCLLLLCGVAAQLFVESPLHDIFSHLSVQAQLAEMAQGVVSSSRLVFSITLITLPLFFATRAVESWRDA
jgi:ABC-2 type transport system permease protein